MKSFLVLLTFLYLVSCGSSGSGRVETRPTGKESPEKLNVDWKSTRTPVTDRDEPLILGLDTTADWFQPKENENADPKKSGREIKGYRLQIYSSPLRTKADEVAAEARNQFGLSIYITFAAPNYVVRTGNYQTLEEAKNELEKLIQVYPNAAIVPDFIRIP